MQEGTLPGNTVSGREDDITRERGGGGVTSQGTLWIPIEAWRTGKLKDLFQQQIVSKHTYRLLTHKATRSSINT